MRMFLSTGWYISTICGSGRQSSVTWRKKASLTQSHIFIHYNMSASALLQSVKGTDELDVGRLFDVQGWVIIGRS